MGFIRDARLLAWNIRKASVFGPTSSDSFYWDDAPRKDVDSLIDHLSDPNQPERKAIREIILDRGIKTILDAGCGPATELVGFQEAGVELTYVGLDRSRYMLENARRRSNRETSFLQGSLEEMPFQDGSFDAVILKHVLEHLQDYRQAVREAVRVAQKIVIIDFFHRPIPLLPFDLRLWQRAGFYENWYSQPKFERFLESLPITTYTSRRTEGNSGNTAMIYVLEKEKR